MTLDEILLLVGELGALSGVAVSVLLWIHKISVGTKCQLRSEMLRIYYHNRDTGVLRQYEYENFVMLYNAYKSLRGNSFIDKIYAEVREWRVVT